MSEGETSIQIVKRLICEKQKAWQVKNLDKRDEGVEYFKMIALEVKGLDKCLHLEYEETEVIWEESSLDSQHPFLLQPFVFQDTDFKTNSGLTLNDLK